MRGLLGVIVLIAGIAGLGYWGSRHQAENMQTEIANAASEQVANSIHGVTTEVSGRDIVLNGLVDSEQERDQLVKALDAVPGRRVVRDETTVLETAAPYKFDAGKDDNGVAISGGDLPQEKLRASYANVTGAEALVLASGAPEGWMDATQAGLAALDPLQDGSLSIEDQSIRLTGTALTNNERDAALAALSGLGAYSVEDTIKILDDGKPAAFTLDWTAANGGALNGKLPKGLSAGDLAGALGASRLAGTSFSAIVGEDGAGDNVPAQLSALKPWLPQVETAKYVWDNGASTLDVQLIPGGNSRLVQVALQKELPDTRVKVTAAESSSAKEGDERTNAATGQTEQFTGGFWLPKVDFEPTLTACTALTDDALAKNKINFLSGSANLDASAVLAINTVAAVVRRCTINGKLSAELGGHTDDVGNPASNLALSQARASAVRLALINRGIPAAGLTSAGYGQTQPIATNTTEEGRAKNRRTTIRWSAN